MQPEDQPTVKRLGGKAQAAGDSSQALDAAELRQLALECGADDAGLVEISRPGLDPQRDELLRYYEVRGIRAVNPSMGCRMRMYHTPSYAPGVVSQKPIAVEAGLGHMGIHRNLIHPKFGNFVLLGTVLTELDVETYDHPIEYNPCLECKLCVAACPVGAIGPDGS